MKFPSPAAVLAAAALIVAGPAASGEAWDDVSHMLYGDRALLDGAEVVAIAAPYRTPDDGRTDIGGSVVAPPGMMIDRVTLVLDENPMPVSAVFDLAKPLPRFFFDVTMRVNGPTPVHVVAETTDGRLWVAETYVKTSGLGACAAPPVTDPELALATLGDMRIEMAEGPAGMGATLASGRAALEALGTSRLDLDVSHPSHSGMQKDQISLLFIPMRYVETVALDLDGAAYLTMTGSISLSENPRIAVSAPSRTQSVEVELRDTDGTVRRASRRFGGY